MYIHISVFVYINIYIYIYIYIYYIYLYVLWNFWRATHTKSFRHREYMNESYLSTNGWDLKTMVLTTIFHGKSTKRPHHNNVVQNVAIYVCWKTFPPFVLMQTLYWAKELNWLSSVATEINLCYPTLRTNCHCMVFNYLPQFLYKDT